ncbi:MAG: hypothetical protein L3J75_09115 [Methylococcaceae bacterium]|nr:hypothetical protein [Methylococcaceae bacterium]
MRILSVLVLISVVSLVKADYRKEIKLLESKFLKTELISITYKFQDLPEDIQSWIKNIADSNNIANFGEAYNEIDLIDPKLPSTQHQYTLFNNDFSVSLIKVGGIFPVKWLLLVDRTNNKFACKYHLDWKVEFSEGLKYLIGNKREAQSKKYLKGLCEKIENDQKI